MSELCNNSACFSVEIKDASDICVTFVVYACGKSIKKHLPPQRGKEKLDNRNQVKIKKISMIFHGFYCTLKIPEEKALFFRVV